MLTFYHERGINTKEDRKKADIQNTKHKKTLTKGVQIPLVKVRTLYFSIKKSILCCKII